MKRRNEGFITTDKGKVWYEIVGKKNSIPLITVHGGPGYPHDYLEPLEDLSDERQVVFYDQLGCGNSQWPSNKSFWSVKYFVSELGKLIKQLDLKEYHILGQSWGAALAVGFTITKPRGLKSIILADPFLSTPLWVKDAKRLLKKFPKTLQAALATKDYNSKTYKKALDEFYYRHVFLMKKYPVAIMKSDNKMNVKIYREVWGPEEFNPSGLLKDFDITDKLSQINIPTLLLAGRFDEATPEVTEYFMSLIPNSQVKIFEKSAHMPHWIEREKYIKTIRDFLHRYGIIYIDLYIKLCINSYQSDKLPNY